MIFINEKIVEYSIKNSDPPSNLLNDLERETNLKILQPRMLSGNFQGRFLSFLSKISKPKSVIEIGTYTGYSALCIAEGLDPNGVIHTIDNNEELTYIQNKYFEKSNYRSNIKQYTDDAIKILPKLNITFDFAFIDADKINYINYFEIIIKKIAITVMEVMSNLPIISVGLVKIELKSRNLKFKNTSEPITINTEKKEKIIKLAIKLKLPFFSSSLFLT